MFFLTRELPDQKPICPITKVEIENPICVISRDANSQIQQHYFEYAAFFEYVTCADRCVVDRPIYNFVDGSLIIAVDEANLLRNKFYLDTWNVWQMLKLSHSLQTFNHEQTRRINLNAHPVPDLTDIKNIINKMPKSYSDLRLTQADLLTLSDHDENEENDQAQQMNLNQNNPLQLIAWQERAFSDINGQIQRRHKGGSMIDSQTVEGGEEEENPRRSKYKCCVLV